jgi:anti-sigma factor RsiW
MKDHRFIELINLYIDRQISAAETAELEAEIQDNPRRRSVYRQYCKMHRATTLVYDSFRAQAPGQAATEPAVPSTVELFENRRGRRSRLTFYAGGLAAAACFALVFVRLNSERASDRNILAATASHPAVPVATTQPAVLPIAAPTPQPVAIAVGPVSLRNATEPDYAALLAALRQEEQRNGQVQSGRQLSLFEDGVFESPQALPATNQRTFRSRQTPAQQAEFTAFQFQR